MERKERDENQGVLQEEVQDVNLVCQMVSYILELSCPRRKLKTDDWLNNLT